MRALPKILFSIGWFVVIISSGAFVLFRQTLDEKKLVLFGERFSFSDAHLSFSNDTLSLKITNISNEAQTFFIDLFTHTCSLRSLLSLQILKGSSIAIQNLKVSTQTALTDFFKTSSPESLNFPLGHIHIEKTTITFPKEKTLTLRDLNITQNVLTQCRGSFSYAGFYGTASFNQGFRTHRLQIKWTTPPTNPLLISLDMIRFPSKNGVITGTTTAQISKKALSTTTTVTLGNIPVTIYWDQGKPLRASVKTLSLYEVNFLTKNFVHDLTYYDAWALRDVRLSKVRLRVPCKKNTLVWDDASLKADLSHGVVFLRDLGIVHDLTGLFAFTKEKGWHITVQRAITDSGFVLNGYLDPKNARFSLSAPTQAAINIFSQLDILDKSMLTNASGDVTGTLMFPTIITEDWKRRVRGSFTATNSSCTVDLSALPGPTPTKNIALSVTFADALCSIKGSFVWENTPVRMQIEQTRQQNSSLTDLSINLSMDQINYASIKKVFPFLATINAGEGPADLHILRHPRPEKPCTYTVAASGRAVTPFEYCIAALQLPIKIHQWSVTAQLKNDVWVFSSIELNGPGANLRLTGTSENTRITFHILPSRLASLWDVEGSWTQTRSTKAHSITLRIPSAHINDRHHFNTHCSDNIDSSVYVYIHKLHGAHQKTLDEAHILFKSKKYGSAFLDAYVGKSKESASLCLYMSWNEKLLSSCTMSGYNLSHVFAFFGVPEDKFSVEEFYLDGQRSKDSMAVTLDAKKVSIVLPAAKQSFFSSIFVNNNNCLQFPEGTLKGSFSRGVLTIESASLNSDAFSVTVYQGAVDCIKGKLSLLGSVAPFKTTKRGVAILTPALAKVFQGNAALQSPLAWHFNIDEEFPAVPLFSESTDSCSGN